MKEGRRGEGREKGEKDKCTKVAEKLDEVRGRDFLDTFAGMGPSACRLHLHARTVVRF